MKTKIIVGALVLVGSYLLVTQFGILPTKEVLKKLPGQEFELNQPRTGFDLNKLKQGCPVKDCIPAIDNPKFISASEAQQKNQIEDDDVVFAVFHEGTAKAYPQRILNWHEIVNDTLRLRSGQAVPILITFCPLCGTAIGFERSADTTFGVSGKLVNSNLVIYDRKTQTLWQQLGGEAIVGELVGQKLKQFPVDTLLWKDWKKLHPDTQVLSQDTGFTRDYSSYPYGTYESDRSIYFPAEGESDDRLHPKQIVWGIEINGKFKAYDDKKLSEVGMVKDTFNKVSLKIERNKEGQVRISKEDGSQIIPDRSMWFAWVSFHPETQLFK